MRVSLCVLAMSLGSLTALAAPPTVVEVPRGDPATWQEVKAPRGRLLRLSADPKSKWVLIDDSKADLWPVDDGKFGDFAASDDGRYKLLVTSPDGTPTRVVVVVGTGVGPLPGPGPGPNPPVPPVDPLIAKLKAAIDADESPKKKQQVGDLAGLYRAFAAKSKEVKVTTPKQLISLCREAAVKLIGEDSLLGVREIVAAELVVIFPVLDTPIEKAQRDAATALFERLASILETQ